MSRIPRITIASGLGAVVLSLGIGCHHCGKQECCQSGAQPLGTISDSVWQKQEENAEASDFVIHEHEFVGDSIRLNAAGEDHLKQVAVRVASTPYPVIVEPSSMSAREGTKHGFPVHGDDDLDRRRRELVVRALVAMGVQDADERVVVAPALTPGYEQFEAEGAYGRGFTGFGRFGGGGGFGGFGGLGGVGTGFY